MNGNLYIVATPIGHLEDLTPRARQTLSDVSVIAAEDTRHTGRLLFSFGCKTPLMALHEHNESDVVTGLIMRLQSGDSVALVSDAGTPLVSDPGYRLVKAAHAAGVSVSPIPGPSAVVAALCVAGIPTDRFCFEGFLPPRQKARRDRLERLVAETRTLVFYEAVHRIGDTLTDMAALFGGERQAFLAREMTKMHEQCVQDSLSGLVTRFISSDIVAKGEFVIVVAGNREAPTDSLDLDRLLLDLSQHLPAKEVARIVARASQEKKNALYERLLVLKRDAGADDNR